MSLVSWPWRKVFASAPVSARRPRPARSTSSQVSVRVLTTPSHRRTGGGAAGGARPPARARCAPPAPALEPVVPQPRGPARLQRRPGHRGLLGAVELLEQREQPLEALAACG